MNKFILYKKPWKYDKKILKTKIKKLEELVNIKNQKNW